MKKIRIKTKGMHCPSCEMLVADSLEETAGVKSVEASHKSGIISVEFDEKQVNESKIKEIIENEGYEVL